MRLEALTRNQLSADQLAIYEQIVSGPRASGGHFALTDSSGALTGPFGIMLHAPALGLPLQELGAAIRYRTSLTPRIREIAILAVAAATDSAFERYAHERVGRAVGLTENELGDLAARRFRGADDQEQGAYEFCSHLLKGAVPLAAGEFEAFRAQLEQDGLIELTVLVGYYRTLSQLLHVFDVGVPENPSVSEQGALRAT